MAKDPATLWYWNDWQGGTVTLTRHLKGCYIDLLHAQFNSGRLSLAQIKTVLGVDFGTCWPILQEKFKRDENDKYYNQKAETEKFKRQKFVESRSNNKSGRPKKSHDSKMKGHMEDESINEDEIGIGSFGKFENLLTEIEIGATIEFISITANKTLIEKEVTEYFKAFIIHSEGKFYPNRQEKIQHFRTWLKIQIEKHGSHQQTPNSTKQGTSEARTEALKKW